MVKYRRTRRSRTRGRSRTRVKKQKGGFSYAVMEGVRAAAVLTPIAIRQAINLVQNAKTRKTRKNRRAAKK